MSSHLWVCSSLLGKCKRKTAPLSRTEQEELLTCNLPWKSLPAPGPRDLSLPCVTVAHFTHLYMTEVNPLTARSRAPSRTVFLVPYTSSMPPHSRLSTDKQVCWWLTAFPWHTGGPGPRFRYPSTLGGLPGMPLLHRNHVTQTRIPLSGAQRPFPSLV